MQDNIIDKKDNILSNKSDETLVQMWRERIDAGIKFRQKTSGKDDIAWKRYKEYYRGDWEDSVELSIDISEYLPVNRIYPYIRATVPKIYFRNPAIIVTKGLIKEGFDDKSVLQDVVNYLMRELGVKQTLKKTVLYTLLLGTGVLKYGFGSQYVSGELNKTKDGKLLEHNANIKPGLPWIQAINPADFVVPYGTKNFNDVDWCAHAVWRPLEYAQADKNYINRDKLVGTKIIKSSTQLEITEDNILYVRLWEIHDKTNRRMLIIADKSNFLHYIGEDVLQLEHLPFRILCFDDDPDTMWGISAVKIMEPQQLELNDIRTMEAAYRRRDFTKIAVDTSVSAEEIKDLNDASKPLAVVRIPDPKKNIMLLTTSMPQDLARASDEVEDDIRFSIGFSRNQAGEVSTGRRTAYEIDIAREASEIRNDERRDIASDAFVNIANDLLQLSFILLDSSTIQAITGGAIWHQRTRDVLAYDFNLECSPEESRPISTTLIQAQETQIYQALLNNPLISPIVNLTKFLEAFKKNPLEYIDPQMAQALMIVLQQMQGKTDA